MAKLASIPDVPPHNTRIPLWLKLAYTAFATIFVIVLSARPAAFLWFCNAAVLITLAAIWMESSLLASTQFLAVAWPQVVWQIDVVCQLVAGVKVFRPCGLTPADYMFDPAFPNWYRCISTQHAWSFYLLLWIVWRLGYDRRALVLQTTYAWVLLFLTFALVTDIRGPAGNVNNIYGMSETEPQTWMPRLAWLGFLMVFLPLCWYGPLHFLLCGLFPAPQKGHNRRSS